MQNQNSNRKKKKNGRKAAKSKAVAPVQPVPYRTEITLRPYAHLSACAADYARSLANPRSGPGHACVPTFPVQFSRKFRVFVKGTFTTGTASAGFIVFSPELAVANNQTCIFFSASTWAGTTIQTAGGAGISSAQSNSDYSSVDIGTTPDKFGYKVVSAGLYIRCIANALTMEGRVVGFSDPNHGSCATRNYADLASEETARQFSSDRVKWQHVKYRTVDGVDTGYRFSLPANTNTTADSTFYMAFVCAAPGSLSWEFEAYANYETYGKNIRGGTPSHADPVGFHAVHSAGIMSSLLYPTDKTDEQLSDQFLKEAARQLVGSQSTVSLVPTTRKGSKGGDLLSGISDATGSAKNLADIGNLIWGGISGIFDWLF